MPAVPPALVNALPTMQTHQKRTSVVARGVAKAVPWPCATNAEPALETSVGSQLPGNCTPPGPVAIQHEGISQPSQAGNMAQFTVL